MPHPSIPDDLPENRRLPDDELLARACRGCGDSFRQLFDRYRAALLALIHRAGVAPPDDEDVLQVAYQRFAYHQDAVRNAPAFLIATVKNLCANYHRDARRQRELVERFVSESRPRPSPPTATEARIMRSLDVHHAIRTVGRKCRELVDALVLRQRSYNEYAESTGIPRNTLGPAVVRCLKRMRAFLERHGYGSLQRDGNDA